ncbi:DUF6274 family protein [Streptomyces sp. NPDC002911]
MFPSTRGGRVHLEAVRMSASTQRHETRALLRAHLAAASGYRHLTRHCPICYRLLRLAMEPLTAPQAPYAPQEAGSGTEPPPTPEAAAGTLRRAADDEGGADRLADQPRDPPGSESPPAT